MRPLAPRPGRARIVGALSAGNIIESGSNANGSYVRFADGTQVCQSIIILTDIDIAPDVKIWDTESYTPPAAFSGEYMVHISKASSVNNDTQGTSQSIMGMFLSNQRMGIYNTGHSFYYVNPGVAIRDGGKYRISAATIYVTAIGKWK